MRYTKEELEDKFPADGAWEYNAENPLFINLYIEHQNLDTALACYNIKHNLFYSTTLGICSEEQVSKIAKKYCLRNFK